MYGNHLARTDVAHYTIIETNQEQLQSYQVHIATEPIRAEHVLDLLVGVNQNETSLCINLTFEMPANNFQAITPDALITSAFAPELRDGVQVEGRWFPVFVSTSRLADPANIVVSARFDVTALLQKFIRVGAAALHATV